MNTRVAIVTGAGSGIGRAAAQALLREGFLVVFAGRRRDVLEAALSEVGCDPKQGIAIPVDVTDPESVSALFSEAMRAFGRLDFLFNNAGIFAPSASIETIPYETWRAVLDTNLTGAFLCTQQAIRIMKEQKPQGGRILNNGSVSAQVPRVNSAAYTSSKHALTGLTKSTSLDGRKYGIACGQIDIGNVVTELTEGMSKGFEQADGSVRQEPVMSVDDVARMIVQIACLPLTANMQFMTLLATQMPFIGRG